MSETWRAMGAADLGREIESGRLCPVALAEAFLDAAESHEMGARIYARLTRQRALDAAAGARARARSGLRRGPLDGVPVSWKDLFDTAGIGTEAGTLLLAGRVPDTDAAVVARLDMAGLPCLGKTHMTELAFSGLGLNPSTASPPWRHDPAHVSGGSSSGAAASLAWGVAPLAIGSDTGGSVRVPAGWNDLVGLKTTPGRISLQGVVPLAPRFDTVGPLARSVEDAALALALLDGSAPPDLRGATLSGVRLAVLETVALDDLAKQQAQGFERALARLEAAGARIERIRHPELADAMALSGILYTSETYGTWGALIEAMPERMFAPVRARFQAGADHKAADYVAAWQALEQFRTGFARAMAPYDAVLVPTTANMPPRIDALEADHDYFTAENLMALRNTRICNLSGGCALTLPTGEPAAGISLMAPPMAEARLLRLGAAAEAALG